MCTISTKLSSVFVIVEFPKNYCYAELLLNSGFIFTSASNTFAFTFSYRIQYLTCHARVAFGTEQLGCDFLAGKHQHISIFSFLTAECQERCVAEHPVGKQYQHKSEEAPTLQLSLERLSSSPLQLWEGSEASGTCMGANGQSNQSPDLLQRAAWFCWF
ncbi:hypothetical protein AMECASPLE_027613 [Ameca splendens]|uniref:Uncharacterized protein n=1 Tax=Ameca splendens TaxID=208324 RepID=A0ABV0ZS99_9TELE